MLIVWRAAGRMPEAMKTKIILASLLVCALGLFAQAEKVKAKAKDLKKQVEEGQTNRAGIKTNAPAKPH